MGFSPFDEKNDDDFLEILEKDTIRANISLTNEVNQKIQMEREDSNILQVNGTSSVNNNFNKTINPEIKPKPEVLSLAMLAETITPLPKLQEQQQSPQWQQNGQDRKSEIDEMWPSLSDASRIKDKEVKKGDEIELGAWGQIPNITSVWGTPKKWKSETEQVKVSTASVWNPDDVHKLKSTPVPEPKAPMYFKRKKVQPLIFDLDDKEGWGAPPEKYVAWSDQRQGYCHELIQEQNDTKFWSKANGKWISVTDENKINEEDLEEDTRDPERLDDNISKKGKRVRGDGKTWEAIRDNSRAFESLEENVRKDLESENSFSSFLQNLKKPKSERLGNPRWKTEEEWRKIEVDDKHRIKSTTTNLSDLENNEDVYRLSENDEEDDNETDLIDTDQIKDTYETPLNEQKEEDILLPNIDSGHGSEEEALNDKAKAIVSELEENKDQINLIDISVDEVAAVASLQNQTLLDNNQREITNADQKLEQFEFISNNNNLSLMDESTNPIINEKDDNNKVEGITSNEHCCEKNFSTRSVPETNNEIVNADILIKMKVETPKDGSQSLIVSKMDNLEQVVGDFCQKWQMKELKELLQNLAKKKLKSKLKGKHSSSKNMIPSSNTTTLDSVIKNNIVSPIPKNEEEQ
ncbi:3033_t:CDS:2 [Ambispora gerdemannii]|uniref:3033_t:CDS:1 n=1 Tax=Ambispora gerdemannii TaxID=144530 RepID=A0A9N9BST3_9GLOM|nr:3033_t:CDS:2 [Ambispora gerdemannii]